MSSEQKIFECQECGECCKGYGGTYVTPEDILTIAAYINTDPDHFVENYCQMSGSRPVLAQGQNGYCVFWKDKLCSIHPVKPRMCRAWPYLKTVVADVENWRMMATACPGIRTNFPDEVIRKNVQAQIDKRKK